VHERDLAMVLAGVVVRRGKRGFTFEDLLRVATRHRATLGDVAAWLAAARSSGLVADLGFDHEAGGELGPRRYRLAGRGDVRDSSADRLPIS
jgi:hypothetical protein